MSGEANIHTFVKIAQVYHPFVIDITTGINIHHVTYQYCSVGNRSLLKSAATVRVFAGRTCRSNLRHQTLDRNYNMQNFILPGVSLIILILSIRYQFRDDFV